jgi:hypothetical protein
MELLAIPLSPKIRGKWLVIPRRRESSKKKILRAAINTIILSCFAGIFNQLDSRLRGNDGSSE